MSRRCDIYRPDWLFSTSGATIDQAMQLDLPGFTALLSGRGVSVSAPGRRAAPILSGPALDAVRHRGSHLQIIASAGSGKTEVVSQRVVDLLAEGAPAEDVVAFTFTERAAGELQERITSRVEGRMGRG